MKPAVPWSVKGIEPEARAAAKSAARQAGMTLGQWLNQVILTTEDGQNPSSSADLAAHRLSQEQPGDSEITGLHQSLSEMASRFEDTERKHEELMSNMEEALSGVAARIDAYEDEGNDAEPLPISNFEELQNSQDTLLRRIEQLELAAEGKTNLTELENALGQVVSHIETSDRKSLKGLQSMEQVLSHMVKRLEALEQDERRSSELISTALQRLDRRIEDKQELNQERIIALEETLGGIKERLAHVERRTSDSAGSIKHQLLGLVDTLERVSAQGQNNAHPSYDTLANRVAVMEQQLREQGKGDEVEAARHQEDVIRNLKEIAEGTQHSFQDADEKSISEDEEEGIEPEQNTEQESFATSSISKLDFNPEQSAQTKSELLVESRPDTHETSSSREHNLTENKLEEEEGPSTEDDIPAILKADLKRSAPPKEESGDTLPPWLRNAKDSIIEAEESETKRLSLRTIAMILALAFAVMAVASFLILREDGQGLTERPGIGSILKDFTGGTEPLAEDAKVASSSMIISDVEGPLPDETDGETPTTASETDSGQTIDDQTASTPLPTSKNVAPDDTTQTLSDLQQSALNGDKRAQYTLAELYLTGTGVDQDPETGAFLLRQSAEQGFAPAQYRYGVLFERGLGVKRNAEMALGWYEAAALLGHLKAMYNLAVLYAQGSGAEQSFAKAAKWFEEAAQRGLVDAQFNLAILFLQGKGVDQDLIHAYQWFSLAATDGDPEAEKHRMEISQALSNSDLKKAETMVEDWKSLPVDLVANGLTTE